ncbi:MAG: hypothetical protein GY793_05650 [Proteobacteria bacterium]|nr:hypothetical protein [Pseudomonadota bacterium]
MLQTDFSHITGIGKKTEQELARIGIKTWQDYIDSDEKSLKDHIKDELQNSIEALKNKDTDFFASRLDNSQKYKILADFPEDTIFLDIETTGLSLYYDSITLIGYSKNGKFGAYIHDGEQDPAHFLKEIATAKAIVTFNGTIFDLKFIKKAFPEVKFPKAHLDLRFFAKRYGLTGGQKITEIETGFKRKQEIKTILGEAAPILWHQYRRGNIKSMHKLIEYNKADVQGMKYILDYIFKAKLNIKPLFYKKSDDKINIVKEQSQASAYSIFIPTPDPTKLKPLTTYKGLNKRTNLDNFCVIGIDLVSSELRESGMCALKGNFSETCRMNTDEEMIEYAKQHNADLISIDSPLSIPVGRTSFFDDDPFRNQFGITRLCERLLKKRGVNSYPCLIPSMQKLTKRGMELTQKFKEVGIDVIESYPGAAQDVMNIPRKQAGLQYLTEGLSEFGVVGDFQTTDISHDELDAITSAIVGLFYKADMFEALGNEKEDYLIIPKI